MITQIPQRIGEVSLFISEGLAVRSWRGGIQLLVATPVEVSVPYTRDLVLPIVYYKILGVKINFRLLS